MSTAPLPHAIPGGTFDDAEHVYKDKRGRRIASATQVFALLGMIDYSRVREEILERKSQLGVAVHAAVQYLCEGCLDWDTVDPVALPYVVAAEYWIKEQGFTSIAQEEQGIAEVNGMMFGFMMDNRGTMMYKGRHRHVILDYKTCVAESPTWPLQTAAYALAAPKLPNGEKYLRVILQLKADGKAKPYYFEDREDENSFLYALYVAIWMLNRGFTIEK